MKTEFNKDHLRQYCYSAVERECILMRRSVGDPRPWTKDPVLHKYRFCNVFRQDDKCSVWMINYVIRPAENLKELMESIIVYRYISSQNIYDQLTDTLGPSGVFDLKAVNRELWRLKRAGELKFNGCFLRNPHANGQAHPIVNVPFLIVQWLREHWTEFEVAYGSNNFETLTKFFMDMPATSGFMAHQYCCDLEYSDMWNPTDKYTYATMGPGSKQGMNLVLGRPRKAPLRQAEWLEHARELRVILQEAFQEADPCEGFPWDEDFIAMQDVQNWLCEYQKYVKYKALENGGKKVKVRYYN